METSRVECNNNTNGYHYFSCLYMLLLHGRILLGSHYQNITTASCSFTASTVDAIFTTSIIQSIKLTHTTSSIAPSLLATITTNDIVITSSITVIPSIVWSSTRSIVIFTSNTVRATTVTPTDSTLLLITIVFSVTIFIVILAVFVFIIVFCLLYYKWTKKIQETDNCMIHFGKVVHFNDVRMSDNFSITESVITVEHLLEKIPNAANNQRTFDSAHYQMKSTTSLPSYYNEVDQLKQVLLLALSQMKSIMKLVQPLK